MNNRCAACGHPKHLHDPGGPCNRWSCRCSEYRGRSVGRDVAENVLEAMAEQMIAHFGYGLVTDNDKALAAAMLRAGLEAAGYGKVDELRVLYTLEQAAPPTSDGR